MSYEDLSRDELIELLNERDEVPPKQDLINQIKQAQSAQIGIEKQITKHLNRCEGLTREIANLEDRIEEKRTMMRGIENAISYSRELLEQAQYKGLALSLLLDKYYKERV